jgi:hypothetical protein
VSNERDVSKVVFRGTEFLTLVAAIIVSRTSFAKLFGSGCSNKIDCLIGGHCAYAKFEWLFKEYGCSDWRPLRLCRCHAQRTRGHWMVLTATHVGRDSDKRDCILSR